MSYNNIDLQNQGSQKTPLLWSGVLYETLQAFQPFKFIHTKFQGQIPNSLRLGKRVEIFTLDNLLQQDNIEIIAHNVQIQREQLTLGELDCILKLETLPIHLEIVYKFYLYVPQSGEGLHAWIGPNQKDSLMEKLNRLKNHQLPLLYQPECISYLKSKLIKVEEVAQRVLFKAQLFIPENLDNINFEGLNEACVTGFYTHFSNMKNFENCNFYIPTKHDWLLIPHTNVDWLSFDVAHQKIMKFINDQFSPMIWIKHSNGQIQKYFITWWL